MDLNEAIATLEKCMDSDGCKTCKHEKEDCNTTVIGPVLEILKGFANK